MIENKSYAGAINKNVDTSIGYKMRIKNIEYYENNVKTLTTHELRTYNRYYLHPNDKRCCSKCKSIYFPICENFHIKKYSNGKICWNVKCKICKNTENQLRMLDYRKDYKKKIASNVAALRNRAKEIGVDFDLDAEYLINLFESQNQKCYYTNEEISFENIVTSKNRPHNYVPSLDRLYPHNGYTKGNVVWCSYYVNRMKNELNEKSFYDLCIKILKNRNLNV